MDILHSPADVGAGDEGSDDRNDCGSLLHPVPNNVMFIMFVQIFDN